MSLPHSDPPARQAQTEPEARAAFHLRLRGRGVRDLAVLRVFELTPRAGFFPECYAALAARDLPLPLPCGQTSHEPWLSARAVEALGVETGHRVLEVGSGSGYVTAILAQLAGSVLGVERFGGLATVAGDRLRAFGFDNASVAWADGLALPAEAGDFDRILVHAAVDVLPPLLADRLAPGGRVVAGWKERLGRQSLATWDVGGEPKPLGTCRYAPLESGLSAAL